MSIHNRNVPPPSALSFAPSWLGAVAAAGLLLGCVAELGDEPNDVGEGVEEVADFSESELLAAAAGDPAIVGTTVGTAQNGTPGVRIPNGTREGDLLLLFLHRTDAANLWTRSDLKANMSPWRHDWQGPVASCAVDNGKAGDFNCEGRQGDLNQVVYWKRATADDLRKDGSQFEKLSITFPRGSKGETHPAWLVMASVRNAEAGSNPVRAWKGQLKCDKIRGTRFPSVSGNKSDLLLLTQSFDDGRDNNIASGSFTANTGFTRIAQVIDKDEAGHLYSRLLTATGDTAQYETNGGSGSPAECKDLAMSIVIKKAGT